ncbi:MAG: hypothetical protein WCG87_11235 [Bacteroidota bacterium]
MRFLISILSIAIVSGIAAYMTNIWWCIAVVAFITTLISGLAPGKGFLAGFCGVLLLWGIWALLLDLLNQHILSQRMAALFHLPNYALFIVVIALIGGLIGGFAGWSGSLLRSSFT